MSSSERNSSSENPGEELFVVILDKNFLTFFKNIDILKFSEQKTEL